MNIPQESELDNNGKRGKPYLQKRYPEFVKYLEQRYPDVNKFSAAIYLYYRNMEHPKCPICGKPTPFLDYTRGFQRCCSSKCATNDPAFREKSKQTNLRKYGVEHASQNKDIKKKIVDTTVSRHGGMGNASESTKAKQQGTMLDKYGAKHARQVDELNKKANETLIGKYGGCGARSQIIADKIAQTMLDKYGVPNYALTPEMHAKARATNLKRYGFEIATQNPEISNKISRSKMRSFTELHNNILYIEKDDNGDIYYTCKCPHEECRGCTEKQYKILAQRYCDRRLDGTEPCTNLLPVMKSHNKNTSLELFVSRVLDECGVDPSTIKTNYRALLSPKEVDIYDPIHGIAFECNGCYWHSDERKSPAYHVRKYKECQAKGVQLIAIWEDWILKKPEIVKSIIKSKYHYFEKAYYARKCEVKMIPSSEVRTFYDTNHIQGHSNASKHYGLYYNNELISAMSFSKMRGCMGSQTTREGQWELVRFCNKLNTHVIGGAGKLLQRFIRDEQPTSVVSFSSNDISNGSLYKKLGFEKVGENNSYWYIGQDYKRYHRSNFTKAAIVKNGMAPDTEKWTETEVMMKHGFIRIYDSGQTKWVLNLDK